MLPRLWTMLAALCAVVVWAALLSPVHAADLPGSSSSAEAVTERNADDGSASASPVGQASDATSGPGAVGTGAGFGPSGGFGLAGEWLAPGLVGLDWADVGGASGYELLAIGPDGSGGAVLVGTDGLAEGLLAVFDGSSAKVGGLPADASQYWFAVRARSTQGVSVWSPSVAVAVPQGRQPLFDPFTAPTLSDIDVERLGEAVATVTPGKADCSAVPPLVVEGIEVVDPPAGLDDLGVPLTVAEVVRIAGGCVVVDYVALDGRSVAQVRSLLAGEESVHAVGEPVRGLRADHDVPHRPHAGPHHNDRGSARRGISGTCLSRP